jgi:hypothetical protein
MMPQKILRNKKIIWIGLLLLYCVYVVTTVNVKEVEDENFINIIAYYVGFVFCIPATLIISLLPQSIEYLDKILFVFLSVMTVLIFLVYLGWLSGNSDSSK